MGDQHWVAVYIVSNGGNDKEDCWVVSSFCKICKQGIVTSFSEDHSGEAVLDLFAELCFERFYKAKGLFSKLFLNFLFDEETDGSHVLAHGALSGRAKRNRRSATRGEILCRHIKGMKRDLEVWPIGRHKMFVVSSPLRRSTKGRDPLQERTIDEFRMLWLPWATHRKVWHKMEVWTATLAGWPSKRPFCAILFYASPRATKACETRLYTLPFLVQNVDYNLHNGTGLLKRENFNEPFQLCICSRSLLSSNQA